MVDFRQPDKANRCRFCAGPRSLSRGVNVITGGRVFLDLFPGPPRNNKSPHCGGSFVSNLCECALEFHLHLHVWTVLRFSQIAYRAIRGKWATCWTLVSGTCAAWAG